MKQLYIKKYGTVCEYNSKRLMNESVLKASKCW